MDQIGHEDSRMTVEVYASASKRKRTDRKLVWLLMRFPDEPKRSPGSGRCSPACRNASTRRNISR